MLFNVKVSSELLQLIEHATKLSEARNRSEWARDALEAGARAEISQAMRRATKKDTRLGGGFVTPEGRCTHPPQSWVRRPYDVKCGVCGKTVKRA